MLDSIYMNFKILKKLIISNMVIYFFTFIFLTSTLFKNFIDVILIITISNFLIV